MPPSNCNNRSVKTDVPNNAKIGMSKYVGSGYMPDPHDTSMTGLAYPLRSVPKWRRANASYPVDASSWLSPGGILPKSYDRTKMPIASNMSNSQCFLRKLNNVDTSQISIIDHSYAILKKSYFLYFRKGIKGRFALLVLLYSLVQVAAITWYVFQNPEPGFKPTKGIYIPFVAIGISVLIGLAVQLLHDVTPKRLRKYTTGALLFLLLWFMCANHVIPVY